MAIRVIILCHTIGRGVRSRLERQYFARMFDRLLSRSPARRSVCFLVRSPNLTFANFDPNTLLKLSFLRCSLMSFRISFVCVALFLRVCPQAYRRRKCFGAYAGLKRNLFQFTISWLISSYVARFYILPLIYQDLSPSPHKNHRRPPPFPSLHFSSALLTCRLPARRGTRHDRSTPTSPIASPPTIPQENVARASPSPGSRSARCSVPCPSRPTGFATSAPAWDCGHRTPSP